MGCTRLNAYRLHFVVITPQIVQNNNYLYSVYVVLATVSDLEMTNRVWEAVCRCVQTLFV